MYRPDRIGPWMLSTLEAAAFQSGSIPTVTLTSTVRGEASQGAPNESTMAESWFFTEDQVLPEGEGGAFGVKCLGSQLFDEGEYLLSYAGSFVGSSSDEAVAVVPIIGRFNTPGVTGSTMTNWCILPSQTSNLVPSAGASQAPLEVTCNGSVVMGDWTPTGTFGANDLFFGFFMMNPGAQAAAISNIYASMSIHRYEGDLHPWDPNR